MERYPDLTWYNHFDAPKAQPSLDHQAAETVDICPFSTLCRRATGAGCTDRARLVQSDQPEQIMGVIFDVISLSSSLISVVFAILAIWIALHFKFEADTVNQKTQDLLIEVKTDAKAISVYVVSELEKYGAMSRAILMQNFTDSVDGMNAQTDSKPDSFDNYLAKKDKG